MNDLNLLFNDQRRNMSKILIVAYIPQKSVVNRYSKLILIFVLRVSAYLFNEKLDI